MKTTSQNSTGISEKAKLDYAEIYLTRVPIKHQRCIGITEGTLAKLKNRRATCRNEQHHRSVVCQRDSTRSSQGI